MTTLKTFGDCVEYFKTKVEKQGYRFDFIDNGVTGYVFVAINGNRAEVNKYFDGTSVANVRNAYQALKKACNEAYSKTVKCREEAGAYLKEHPLKSL